MGQSLRILIVDDFDDDVYLLQDALRRGGYEVTCKAVDTSDAMRLALEGQTWDVIISDHAMPQFSAPEALALAREFCPDVPFIIVSGEINLNLVVSLMRSGAKDYISENELARLVPTIEREMREAELRREKRRMEKALIESEQRLREVLENSLDASYKRNLLTNSYDYLSPVFTRIAGYTPEEMKFLPVESVLTLIHPDDMAQVDRVITEAISNAANQAYQMDYRFKHKEGHYLWFQDRFIVMRVGDEQPLSMIGSVKDITTRKQAEEALREAHWRMESIINGTHVGTWEWNIQTGEVVFNEGWAEMIGYTLAELAPVSIRTWEELAHPDDLKQSAVLLNRHFNGDLPDYDCECRMKHKDGRWIWIHDQGRVITHTVDDKPLMMFGIHTNITEHKQAEEELRKLSRVVEQSPVSIVITDASGAIEYVNPRFSQVSGYSLQEVLGQNPRILKSGQTPAERYVDLWRTITSGAEWHGEFCNRKKNGDLYWESSSLSPIFNADGKITHFVGVKEDITGRKIAEIEKNRYTEELEMIAQVSKIMRTAQSRPEIHQVILDQLFERLNAEGAALAVYDVQAANLVIETGRGVWEDWVGRRVQVEQCIGGPAIITGQLYVNNQAQNDPDLTDMDLLHGLMAVACAPFIANGQMLGAIWVGRMAAIDPHDYRLLNTIAEMGANAIHRQSLYEDLQVQLNALHSTQNRLLQSEKLAAVGELVAGVAHELNNPLTSVILLSRLMQERNLENLDVEALRDLDQINGEAQRAAKIVRGLLDFARQSPVERRPVQIDDVLESSLDLLKYELQSHRIECLTHFSPGLPVTLADPAQLKQVFVNLINNAWQAINECRDFGRITIKTGLGTPDVPINHSGLAPMLWVTISDDGPGIPLEILPRIFDPFFTTKPEGKGTGLGLSVCHGIIAEHGGYLWAENNPDGGATFFVQLPVIAPVAEPSIPETAQALITSPANLHLMIIDDEAPVLMVITRTLKRAGYQVDSTGDGISALAYLEKTKYDLILCDMRMPDLSGIDLYWKVMEKDPEMAGRMIFTTGDVVSPSTRQFLEETGVAYLPKPFEMKQLVEYVHHRLMKLTHDDSR